ncbi:DUF6282 family protein [Gaiella sp.]|jgi:hypothetical protein|uniref:DUF6282 family protein n=1 Tax=Gaiella sp. TaxID=2663207 RepID=UPI002E30DB4B|nr:DUF6282 family protein [Gaiella sp.]HEX5582639.1 DUF6282 family protein [Gaiella sp.]
MAPDTAMNPTTGVPATEAPSDRARELVRTAYDLHVHIAPDVMKRRIDDVTLAGRFLDVGLAGFGLKSHYTSTAERAQVVARAVPGIDAVGTITLNASVGGLNPLAVEIAAREGARIVWLPTVDAENEAGARDREYPPGAAKPLWARIQSELREQGMEAPPVAVVDEAGEPLPDLLAVLSVVARHGMVVATGHLARDEIFAVVDAAKEAGVSNVVVTHPEFPAQDLSEPDQVALAERGALLERCFTTPYTGKCTWERVADGIRATGAERNLLSTDLGQPDNPPVEDGLALFADRLLDLGIAEDEIRTMTVVNSRLLAGIAA